MLFVLAVGVVVVVVGVVGAARRGGCRVLATWCPLQVAVRKAVSTAGGGQGGRRVDRYVLVRFLGESRDHGSRARILRVPGTPTYIPQTAVYVVII